MVHRRISALALGAVLLVGDAGADDSGALVEAVARGETDAAVTQALAAGLSEDVEELAGMRLALKERGAADEAEAFFEELLERADTSAVRLNLGLAYVDRMTGKNLMRQGLLSTRSQSTVAPLAEAPETAWVSYYIVGLNNLYWPDWFGKAKPARAALEEAVALSPEPPAPGDRYALGHLALGDAFALLDMVGEARSAWEQGALLYPYRSEFAGRLAFSDDEQHEKVRAIRDADAPIDTGLSFLWDRAASDFTITLTGGRLYGPGPLPDQQLDTGSLKDLQLDHALTGEIPPNNNGAPPPNPPGEIRQGLVVDGRLSNGVRAQESVDVGYVELMNGQFKLFLAATQDGPNGGYVKFFLDDQYNWTIFDDIGIDPGFAEGVIEFDDFTFSTAPRVLPLSWQTEHGAPGAVDRAGSMVSGEIVPGRLGDEDADGLLDGTFNAVGRFPLDSIMLPGAPFAQTRVFTSDIPVGAGAALTLAIANRRVHLIHAAAAPGSAEALLERAERQAGEIDRHLGRATDWREGLDKPGTAALERLLALAPGTTTADLCAAIDDLDILAPTLGFFRTDRDVSGVRTICDAL